MEDVFNVKYNEKMDKLEIKRRKKRNILYKFIQSHKFISMICMSFLMFSILNFYLIYSFFKVLENI